jgi:hypothetical protein
VVEEEGPTGKDPLYGRVQSARLPGINGSFDALPVMLCYSA